MSDTTSPTLPETRRQARPRRQKVAAFARYQGTSAWRKDRRRVRAYALFLAAAKLGKHAGGATSS